MRVLAIDYDDPDSLDAAFRGADRIVVSWGVAGNPGLPPGASQVEFTLTPTAGGTRLRLVHRNLPPDQASIHGTGWRHFLGRLGHAATGADPGPDPWGRG